MFIPSLNATQGHSWAETATLLATLTAGLSWKVEATASIDFCPSTSPYLFLVAALHLSISSPHPLFNLA